MPASLRQIASPRPPMPPVTRAMRCFIFISSFGLSALLHVASRRGLDRLGPGVPQPLASGDLAAAMLRDPLRPQGPPAAGVLRRALQPFLRLGPHAGSLRRAIRGADPVAAAVLRRR